MPRPTVLAIALLSSLAATAVATSAFASAAAPIQAGCYVSLDSGSGTSSAISLPANAPAVVLNNNTTAGVTAAVTAELVNGSERIALGAATKDSHGLEIIRLTGATAGAHTIDTKVDCSVGEDRSFQTQIVFTAPVDLPKSVGTLAVFNGGASNSPGTQELTLTPTPELMAFASITSLGLAIGDEPATPSGRLSGSGTRFYAPLGKVCIENGTLHREKRTVKITLTANVAGLAESPAPASLDVTVDCGAIKWTSASDYESGKGSSTTDPKDEGDDASAISSSSGTDGGCSAAPKGLASRNATALVAGALAVLAGLRRRRRAT